MLRFLLVLSAAIGVALCQNCCSGVDSFNLHNVIDSVIAQTDDNGDGFTTLSEFKLHFLTQWDINGDESITQQEFLNRWCHFYCDDFAATNMFFLNLDKANPKGILTEADMFYQIAVGNLQFSLLTQKATNADVKSFLLLLHPNANAAYATTPAHPGP